MAIHDPEVVAVLPKFKGKKNLPKLEFFQGDSKPSWRKHGGTKDNFKIRRGGTYVVRQGEKHSFFERDGIAWFLMHHVSDALGLEKPELPEEGHVLEEPPVPRGMPKWTKVSVKTEGGFMNSYTYTAPWDCEIQGKWVVRVRGVEKPVPLADLELR